jgi:hypothetical protein
MKFPLPTRNAAVSLLATAAVFLTACGSDAPSGSSPADAKASVERAAGLTLTAVPVPAEAKDQGLKASYTNATTAAKDKQVVGLFVMKDADVADEVADLVEGGAPKSAQFIRRGNVMVVYVATGSASDRSDAVQSAVEKL